MEDILHIVLPAFLLIGLGYLFARVGYLGESVGDALADFVFKVAVPVLLMKSIATAEFSGANPWTFVLVYFLSIGAVWVLAILIIRLIFKRGSRAAVIAGVAAGFSNLVLLGIPLVERAYGQEGLQILLFLISVHLPGMMAISTFLMEHAVRSDGIEKSQIQLTTIARNLGRNLMVNPIVIGIFAGLLWRLTGIGIGGIAAQVMDLLAKTTGPLALVSLGMSLIKFGIRGNLFAAVSLAALSLLAMPAVVYLLATTLFALPPLWFKVALLGASCPTGVNAYLIANYFKNAEGLASSTIVLALLGSLVTIPLWLSLVT
ncbi:MAG: AEC family transporter [Hyphomicrobiales bacterium]|nr:AEC family transporter [Hyphomicrobiales bacterium]